MDLRRRASFNPRLRAGGEPAARPQRGSAHCFNPRLRAGGELSRPVAAGPRKKFQSTPPRGRRETEAAVLAAWPQFQSTPPRGRRGPVSYARRATRGVSIHASAREARQVGSIFKQEVQVSIHASAREARALPFSAREGQPRFKFQSTPPRGRRARPTSQRASDRSFNPRLRAGGEAAAARHAGQVAVSIHASAREAR